MQLRNLLTWPWLVSAILLAMACCALADDIGLYPGVPFKRSELPPLSDVELPAELPAGTPIDERFWIPEVIPHIQGDVLQSVLFDVDEDDVAGPHPKRRYRDSDCLRLKLADFRNSGFDKSHARALSLSSDTGPDSTIHTTMNLWPATPYCNRELMREVERYIEWAAPVRVKITAQYDGKAPFIGDRVEVPDAFVYEITNKKLQSRFFVPNIKAPLTRAVND